MCKVTKKIMNYELIFVFSIFKKIRNFAKKISKYYYLIIFLKKI